MTRLFIFICLFLAAGFNALQADSASSQDTKERTLSIIKPDAVKGNHIGEIISIFEKNGLKIVAVSMTELSKEEAGEFYAVHKERPFYPELVEFMSSGPIVALVLEGEGAIEKNRRLMGATNPQEAAEGTIRRKFAKSKGQNAVHGSDSPAAAKEEIGFFFAQDEIYSR